MVEPARAARLPLHPWWRAPWLLPAGITLAALLLRLLRLNVQPLWFDEGYSFYFANSRLADLLARTSVDIHPPLYYLVLKGWGLLWGGGVLSARWLSAVIGTASVPLLFALGRRLGGRRLGLWAALALTVSPFHIYYSQEIRMYGLVTLWAILAGLASLAAFESGGVWRWTLAGLAVAGGLYTQYYAVFVPAGLTLYLMCRREMRRRWGAWLLTLLGALAAYLPWLLYAGPRLLAYVQYKVGKDADAPLSLWEFGRRTLLAFWAGHAEGWLADWQEIAWLPVALLCAGLLVVGARRAAQQEATPRYALCAWGVPLVGAFVVNRIAPFNPPRSERLVLLALPAFCLLLGWTIDGLLRLRRTITAALAGSLLASLLLISSVFLYAFYSVPRYVQDDYRPIAEQLRGRALPGDAVICVLPWQMGFFQAYLGAERPALIESPSQVFPQARQFWADDPQRMQTDLNRLLAERGRIWLPAYLVFGSTLEPAVTRYLDAQALRVQSTWHGNSLLTLHVPTPATSPAVIASARFGDKLEAMELSLAPGPAESAHGVLAVAARWRKLSAFDEGYRMALRLADAQGRSWQHWDFDAGQGRHPFSAWAAGEESVERLGLLIDAGVPPGTYSLRLSVRSASDAPLLVASQDGAEPSDECAMGEVRVVRPLQPASTASLETPGWTPVTLDGLVRLIGIEFSTGPWQPGQELRVALHWQALAAGNVDCTTFVQALGADGAPVAMAELSTTGGVWPTSQWVAGDLARDPQALRLPATLPDGPYRLIAGLFRTSDGSRLPITAGPGKGKEYVELGWIAVQGRTHAFQAPAMGHSADVRFGEVGRLTGYDLNQPAGPHTLTLYWQAAAETAHSYKVFVHVYDAQGTRIDQHDSEPGVGQYPTTGWVAGEYLRDEHPLAAETAGAAQQLWVGMYDAVSGQRLPVLGADGTPIGDHWEIALQP